MTTGQLSAVERYITYGFDIYVDPDHVKFRNGQDSFDVGASGNTVWHGCKSNAPTDVIARLPNVGYSPLWSRPATTTTRIRLLLLPEQGANPNLRDEESNTPLHYATAVPEYELQKDGESSGGMRQRPISHHSFWVLPKDECCCCGTK